MPFRLWTTSATPGLSNHDLFAIAKELEAAAYIMAFVAPSELSAATKGMLGILMDFWVMDQKNSPERRGNEDDA